MAVVAGGQDSSAVRMRALWVSGALAATLFVGTMGYLWPLRPGAIALQFAWHPQTFGAIVHLWPPEGLERYRSHLPIDFVTLLAYGSFGWLLAVHTRVFALLGRGGQLFARLCLPLAAGFDAAENAFHWWLTEMPRFGTPQTYLYSTACSTMKWALLIGFGLLVLWSLARARD